MSKLYIVGTPIGNLKDITFRAVETLNMADIIACEDTRHSMTLLNAYNIRSKLIAYHKFNETECSEKLIAEILDGKNVALITDAGMPSISDPGAILVSECRKAGIDIEVVPGPTALASAIALSGIICKGFSFLGFLPEKKADKVSIVEKVAGTELAIVLYVAPHDLSKTASFLFEVLGDRKAYVVREITKMYESVTITSLKDFEAEERGETVLIVEPKQSNNPLNQLSIIEHLKHYINLGVDKKDAVKKVAADRGIPKNQVYQQALDL